MNLPTRTRRWTFGLWLAAGSLLACGDSTGGAATGTATGTSTGTSTTGGSSGDAPTGSGSADASSGSTSTSSTNATSTTDPDPTTGAVLTGSSGDASTSTTTDATTTGTSTAGETSSSGDTSTGTVLPFCDGADVAAIQAAFVECISPGFIGQSKSISGVTCWDICCAFGINNCSHRAAQADYNACMPDNPPPSGDCADVFQPAWSSQCSCLN